MTNLWFKVNEIGLAATRAYECAKAFGRTDVLDDLKEIGEKAEKIADVVYDLDDVVRDIKKGQGDLYGKSENDR